MKRERALTELCEDSRGRLTTSDVPGGSFLIYDRKNFREGDEVYVEYYPDDQYAHIITNKNLTPLLLTDREIEIVRDTLTLRQEQPIDGELDREIDRLLECLEE
jgi:hypothetical protein